MEPKEFMKQTLISNFRGMKIASLLLVAWGFAFAAGAEESWPAADFYVDDDAAASGANGSREHPYPTIQQAVSAAGANQTIYVAEGVYTNGMGLISAASSAYARVYVKDKPGLKIIGAGRGKSVIAGSRDPSATSYDDTLTETRTNLVSCVYVTRSNDLIIEGFTLKDGETFYGVEPSGVWNCGGGLYADSTSVYLVDCDVLHCTARIGAGIYGGTAVRCLIDGNYGVSSIGCRASVLVNCLLTRNTGTESFSVAHDSLLYNCTLCDNLTGYAVITSTVRNCVIALSSSAVLGDEGKADSPSDVDHSVLASVASSGYRQFFAPAIGDFRLLAGSDAVGAGLATYLSSLDLPPGIDPMKDFTGATITPDGDGRINAGAIQETVVPAGGALVFASGVYEVDGRVSCNRLATYAYPDVYPTQFCVRAVLGEGQHLYRVERYDPESGQLTREYPCFVPSRDGTMWMMPPMNTAVCLTNKSIVATTTYWVDPKYGLDSNAGTSSDVPFATVSNAIAKLQKNTPAVIYLMPGEYTNAVMVATTTARGNFRISIPNKSYKLRMVSTEGPERTFIRGRPDSGVSGGIGPDSLKGAELFANSILQGVTLADCYS